MKPVLINRNFPCCGQLSRTEGEAESFERLCPKCRKVWIVTRSKPVNNMIELVWVRKEKHARSGKASVDGQGR